MSHTIQASTIHKNMDVAEEVAKGIDQLKKMGYTQKEIAAYLGVTPPVITWLIQKDYSVSETLYQSLKTVLESLEVGDLPKPIGKSRKNRINIDKDKLDNFLVATIRKTVANIEQSDAVGMAIQFLRWFGCKQTFIAQLLDVSPQTISLYLNGHIGMGNTTKYRLLEIMKSFPEKLPYDLSNYHSHIIQSLQIELEAESDVGE